MGGGIGAEAEPVRRGGGGDGVEHGARLDQRRLLLGVDVQHVVEVPREVEHEAGRERVACDRGAAAAGDDRRVQLAADGEGGDDLVGAARERDHLGDDPVVGGVGRVLCPPPGRGLDLGQPGRAERGRQLPLVDSLPWRDSRRRGHHSRKPSTAARRAGGLSGRARAGWRGSRAGLRAVSGLFAARFLLLSFEVDLVFLSVLTTFSSSYQF